MNKQRKIEIVRLIKTWKGEFSHMSLKDCLFALYDDKMITDKELDYSIKIMQL